MRTRVLAALLLLVGLVVPAHAATNPLASFYGQKLVWKKCGKTLDCATFKVPLDYRNPTGRSITITAARNKATGVARGNLVMNPGGPGGSGISFIEDASFVVSPIIHREFNLIGFDPRGLARSTPLTCLSDRETDAFLEVDQTPDSVAEEQLLQRSTTDLIAKCRRADAALMQHVSTVEVARDMDILRALLGENRLRYLGKSWGTSLGQAYAALFPERVGSFVLDGAVDNRLSFSRATFDQAEGFETAANRFIAWCIGQGKCVLGSTKSAARSRLITFINQLDEKPLKTSRPQRPLTEEQAWTALIGPLYITLGGWDWLNAALVGALEDKDGTELQNISDWFVERGPRGTYSDNGNTLIYVVNCLDRTGGASLAAAKQQSVAWSKQLPIMGRLMAWGNAACVNWPYRAQESVAALRVRNVPPMIIIGSEFDPATPLKWARAVQQQIPGSVLLVRKGDGHTSYSNGSLCIDRAVDAYLLSKNVAAPVLPKSGKQCD